LSFLFSHVAAIIITIPKITINPPAAIPPMAPTDNLLGLASFAAGR